MFKVFTTAITPFFQNCRVLTLLDTRRCVVVDPGGELETILGILLENSLKVEAIWLTHSHLDHVGAVKGLQDWSRAPLYGSESEKMMRQHVEALTTSYGLPFGSMENCPEPDNYIKEGDELQLGSYKFKVLETPGHSPGHVCFYCAELKIVLAGDALFAGSIGRTDIPGGDQKQLIKSIRTKLLTLPGDTAVLSGHGPDTTIQTEIDSNPFLRG